MNKQVKFLKTQVNLLERQIKNCQDNKEYASLMRLYLATVKEYRKLVAKEEQPEDKDPLLDFAANGNGME